MPETVTTHDSAGTRLLASEAAKRLASLPRDRAAVVTLRGDLGAGKTTFTQGFLSAFGIDEPVTSPTFMLMHRYPLSVSFKDAYHLDAYRLAHQADVATLGLEALIADPANLVLIEWPEVADALMRPALDVRIAHGATESERVITLAWNA